MQIDDLNKILELKEVIFKLESQRKPDDHIEKLFFELHQSKVSIEKVEDWLKLNNNQLKKVKDWFYFQKNENQNKIALQNFTNYLRKNNILSDFDASNWSTDFENEKEKFPKRFEQLKQEIIELQSLSKFTDIENPESLLHWAIANLKFPILHNIESTLIYFQKYGKVKSSEKNGERYIPFPEDLFN
uniref:hypothetical protein n=1 Tax=Acinetobacter guillouiae TaxID=106649 RepID=UPI00125FF2DF